MNTKVTVKDFIETIKKTKEYKEYFKARNIFEKNLEAKKLLEDFQEAQQTYAIFRQGNFPGLEDQGIKLQELHKQVKECIEFQNLLTTQNNLRSMTEDMVEMISQGLSFPFAPKRASGGCCG